jgi:uncharacterized protein YfaP (DUF2135 family)
MIKKIVFLSFLILIASCQNTNKNSEESQVKSSTNPKVEKIMASIEQINAQAENYTVANSLFYQHNDGSTEEVFAYLNKDQQIVKIEEKFKNGKNSNSGVRYFFFENGKRIASKERFIDVVNAKGQFRERLSFYNENGKAIHTNERLALYEEDLEKIDFQSVEPYNCSMETAENVLNQKGVFSTTFQGFATDGPVDYLIVGGPGETGYASALAIQYTDGEVNRLKANEKTMINTPLIVEFEKMMDERKLEFQVLTRVQIDN